MSPRSVSRVRSVLPWILVSILAALIVAAVAPAADRFKAKACLDCHKDMSAQVKASKAHEPFKNKQCETCHLPHGILGKLILKAQGADLCLPCHQDVAAACSLAVVHEPLKAKTCTNCHNPHGTGKRAMLSAEGDASCFSCHDRSAFERQYVHQPVAKEGCSACHAPHASKHAGLLVKDSRELCLSCHKADPALRSAHGNIDVSTANCAGCHDPHSSTSPKLLRPSIHAPVAGMECESCHTRDESGKVTLSEAAETLCVTCHDLRSVTPAFPHPAFADGACTDCHTAHGSPYAPLLRESEARLCSGCHDDVTKKVDHPHPPVVEGACSTCHNAHGSGQPAILKEAEQDLCTSCHSEMSPAGPREPDHPRTVCQATVHDLSRGPRVAPTGHVEEGFRRALPVLPHERQASDGRAASPRGCRARRVPLLSRAPFRRQGKAAEGRAGKSLRRLPRRGRRKAGGDRRAPAGRGEGLSRLPRPAWRGRARSAQRVSEEGLSWMPRRSGWIDFSAVHARARR